MKLLLTGGGTLGSVTPLLAVHEALAPDAVVWIGTRNGQERAFVMKEHIPYFSIFSGKLRRYWDWRNVIDPLFIFFGWMQSLLLLRRLHPTCIVAAGGFVQVPVIFAAWVLRIPTYILQFDVRPGLANRLVAPYVKKVFCVFPVSAEYFPKAKVVMMGSVVREKIIGEGLREKERAREYFRLEKNVPTLLVMGGGTGALSLNEMVWEIVPEITALCQIIHVIGKNKRQATSDKRQALDRYHPFEFLTDDLVLAYAAADLVVTRAGMGVLSELAALRKATITVPLPGTHQEENAHYVYDNGATVLFPQKEGAQKLLLHIRALLSNADRQRELGEKLHIVLPTNGTEKIVEILNLKSVI